MKKILLILMTFIVAFVALASNQMYVIMNDGNIIGIPFDTVVSVVKYRPSVKNITSYYSLIGDNEHAKDEEGTLVIPEEQSGFAFSYNDGTMTACVLGTTQTGDIIIPDSVIHYGKVYAVNYIGSSAFNGCTSLTSLVIGNSVTSIGSRAFLGCTSLTSIEIPNSVTYIGKYAFYGCTNLKTARVPNGLDIRYASFPSTCKIERY